MAKRSRKQKKRVQKRPQQEAEGKVKPLIMQRSGLQIVTLFSLMLAAFMAWQLYPTEGPLRALFWGLAAGFSIWITFGLGFLLHKFAQRRRDA